MKQDDLKNHLKTYCAGRRNATKSAELEHRLHMSGNDLRKQVNRLRKKGVPIASGREGYYYAATAGEVYSTIRQLREMEHGLQAAIRGLEVALDGFGVGVGGVAP